MRDHVVRETSEHHSLGIGIIPKEDGSIALRIERVEIEKRVRSNGDLMTCEAPRHAAAQRALKPREHAHHDGVGAAGVEGAVRFRLRDFLFEILAAVWRRLVENAIRRVVIDDLYSIAARA